ncbi:MAG: site-specific DNA-methyltransferase [Bacteroidetes bacterium HGW-Bacteroidetes-21]|jgi:adenine-specific DNA-methyltransferase|nr:MAG: site-specific DNA-methyltransferase [Bacteroidetes bacterium HGW-Bacteroidetes-21]
MAQKLELTWIGKNDQPKLEPRILIEDPEKSYGDTKSENMLIHGDNLLALKALEQDYAGKIKCIYIDPPYNTGSAFSHYDDGLEHSIWLNLITTRIKALRNLLSEDGSLWINIDDNEGHYLKVACDEIFGRKNFVCGIAWEKRYSPPPDTKDFGYIHDQILVYKKSHSFKRNLLPFTEEQTGRYKNPDNDLRGPWKAMDYTCRYNSEERPNLYYAIKQPNTSEMIWPKKNRVWAMSKEVHEKNERENRIWWGTKGTNSTPSLKNFIVEINQGMMPMSLWKHTLAGHNQDAKKEIIALFGSDIFDTPKPEKLIETILTIATNKNDYVLDSFLGSGTTSAVAHKMGRKWIGVELGDHCDTHCLPRLKMVVDGKDKGGITESANWKGGGGFKYYYLAPSLLKKDKYDNWVIEEKYNADMLAAAMAKHEGFRFNPDEDVYWKQGRSTEMDYIFTTTTFLTVEYLDKLSEEMQSNESLLICCKAFQDACENRYPNITIKKIPQSLMGRCEFGKEDYSLNIVNVPYDRTEPDEKEEPETNSEVSNNNDKEKPIQTSLNL